MWTTLYTLQNAVFWREIWLHVDNISDNEKDVGEWTAICTTSSKSWYQIMAQKLCIRFHWFCWCKCQFSRRNTRNNSTRYVHLHWWKYWPVSRNVFYERLWNCRGTFLAHASICGATCAKASWSPPNHKGKSKEFNKTQNSLPKSENTSYKRTTSCITLTVQTSVFSIWMSISERFRTFSILFWVVFNHSYLNFFPICDWNYNRNDNWILYCILSILTSGLLSIFNQPR